jgi:hypothetical protein
VKIRKIVAVAMGLGIAYIAVMLLIPRLHNNAECKNARPANAAQSAALEDARTRAAAHCASSKYPCHFMIDDRSVGTIRIDYDFVEKTLFDGCFNRDNGSKTFVYGRDGKFILAEEAPYPYR